MLKTLVYKELRNNLLGPRFFFAAAVILGVMLGSTYMLVNDYEESALDYQANRAGSRHLLDEVHNWWQVTWTGVQVVRPLSPMRMVVEGVEANQDPTAKVHEKSKPLIQFHGAVEQNPMRTMFPPVDMMFIVGVILSLLTLVLSYDAVSGERDDGTLKLLLSFPVPRSTLILAKWLGGYLTLCLPFVFGYLCVALWVQLAPGVAFRGADWAAFLLVGLASLLYLAWMFSASLLVSCWVRNSVTAMSVLVFLWVVVVLVVPNVAPYLAALRVPVDSPQSVQFKGMTAVKELQGKENRALRGLEKKYGVRRWWRDDKAWAEGVSISARSHNEQRDAARLFVDERARQLDEQTALAMRMGRLSPLVSYANIVTTTAWTGVGFGRHLMRALREYENRIRAIVTESMMERKTFASERVPYFNYTAPGMGARFMQTVMDWAVLLAGTVLLFLAAYVSFVKRDII